MSEKAKKKACVKNRERGKHYKPTVYTKIKVIKPRGR